MSVTTKVFLDTNVIVAASIQTKSKELGKPISHNHFQESMHLISVLRKHASEQVGITSKTVEGETYNIIIKAVKQEFDKHVDYSNADVITLFDEFSRISNICLNKARQMFSYIIVEQTDSSTLTENLEKVNDMAGDLATIHTKYANRTNRMIEAKKRKQATSQASWTAELHREVYRAFREEVERE